MELPNTLHQRNGLLISDPVEVLIGEAWMPAVLCQREDGSHYWATASLSKLPVVEDWRYATEAGQIAGCDISQHQKRDEKGQTTKASRSNRARKSRQVTQEEG
jgi:hypothetical protein